MPISETRKRFNTAFAAARKKYIEEHGKENLFNKDATFEFEGKKYHMRLKGESKLSGKAKSKSLTPPSSEVSFDSLPEEEKALPSRTATSALPGEFPTQVNPVESAKSAVSEDDATGALIGREELPPQVSNALQEGADLGLLTDIGRNAIFSPKGEQFKGRVPYDEIMDTLGYNPYKGFIKDNFKGK